MATEVSQEFADWFFEDMAVRQRLKLLSNRQLVVEALNLCDADEPVITEMLDRLFPGWAYLSEGELCGH